MQVTPKFISAKIVEGDISIPMKKVIAQSPYVSNLKD
jgi:hypothetical protein